MSNIDLPKLGHENLLVGVLYGTSLHLLQAHSPGYLDFKVGIQESLFGGLP